MKCEIIENIGYINNLVVRYNIFELEEMKLIF